MTTAVVRGLPLPPATTRPMQGTSLAMPASLSGPLASTESRMNTDRNNFWLLCSYRELDHYSTQIMDILNITHDSFSDLGRYNRIDTVIQRSEQKLAAGATIIDVGGESTRPGAALVSVQEEVDRVVPMVEAITARFDTVVSVDTSTPEVMRGSAGVG